MANPYAAVKFKMRAEIGSAGTGVFHTFEDVAMYASSWELNSIPEGVLMVAVGKRVDTQAAATIHTAIQDLKVQLPVKVFLECRVVDKERAIAGVEHFDKDGGELIFEGFIVGAGWRRGVSSAQFTIHMLHWLSLLQYASAISPSSHPGNPSDWKYPAAYAALGLSDAASTGDRTEIGWVPMINKNDIGTETLADIWGLALHKWMLLVSKDDPIETRDAELGGAAGGAVGAGGRSAEIVKALERMGPNSEGAKLEVELGEAVGEVVGEGLRLALVNETGGSWLNTTLWGKLIGEWSPAYWFVVVPRVTDALIVPFAGGLSVKPWSVIGSEDYEYCEASAQLHQVLRAVGIAHPIKDQVGLEGLSASTVSDRTGLAGFYRPKGLEQGLILIKDAPQWLCNPDIAHTFTFGSTGAGGSLAIDTVFDDPATGPPRESSLRRGKVPPDPAEVQKKNKTILDKFAHQWYVNEMLKGRQGELSGKLRFDLAPGSNVLVQAGLAKNFRDGEDGLEEDIFATVNRVSYVINAEAGKAGTSFSLAHTRTAKENRQPETSVDKPPLYKAAWRGAVLVRGVKPEEGV